ncbi:MAG: ATP-binding protein [Leptospiraceae bacterium]|nr:ATP-binding protein [Leptospiraceae bacterium]
MNTDNNLLAILQIKSIKGLETSVSGFFENLCYNWMEDKKRITQIKIAINEVCNNAIEHAHKFDETKYVFVEFYKLKDFFEIIISDQGESTYSPKSIPSKDEIEERIDTIERDGKERGMGTFLIHYFVNSVKYEENKPHGTKVILTIRIK